MTMTVRIHLSKMGAPGVLKGRVLVQNFCQQEG